MILERITLLSRQACAGSLLAQLLKHHCWCVVVTNIVLTVISLILNQCWTNFSKPTLILTTVPTITTSSNGNTVSLIIETSKLKSTLEIVHVTYDFLASMQLLIEVSF